MANASEAQQGEAPPQPPAAAQEADCLFAQIERWQHETGAPFGDVLDAGTGEHSLRWLMRLQDKGVTSITAVTADPTSRARLERDIVLAAPSGDSSGQAQGTIPCSVVVGNWFNSSSSSASGSESTAAPMPGASVLCEGRQYNCVIADYLLGAIECFSPYRQAVLFRRLRPMLTPSRSSRLYVVGLEPFYHSTSGVPTSAYGGDAAIARRARDLLMSIVRLRDAAITLAGHTPHREYPLSWVRQALHDSGFEVKATRSFGNVYGEHALLRMLRTAELKLPFISGEHHGTENAGDSAFAAALRARLEVLRERVRNFVSAHGPVSMGFDYVVEAAPAGLA